MLGTLLLDALELAMLLFGGGLILYVFAETVLHDDALPLWLGVALLAVRRRLAALPAVLVAVLVDALDTVGRRLPDPARLLLPSARRGRPVVDYAQIQTLERACALGGPDASDGGGFLTCATCGHIGAYRGRTSTCATCGIRYDAASEAAADALARMSAFADALAMAMRAGKVSLQDGQDVYERPAPSPVPPTPVSPEERDARLARLARAAEEGILALEREQRALDRERRALDRALVSAERVVTSAERAVAAQRRTTASAGRSARYAALFAARAARRHGAIRHDDATPPTSPEQGS